MTAVIIVSGSPRTNIAIRQKQFLAQEPVLSRQLS